MTEDQREDGWWMANDGNLYPPELHPSVRRRIPTGRVPTLPSKPE